MYKVATLNKISPVGLAKLSADYEIVEDVNAAEGILVRSQDMLTMDFSDNLLAIARAGAGVNNIPLDRCAEEGIVVFNTPGANANAVKELVIGALLLEARNIYDAMHWAHRLSVEGSELGISKAVEKGKGQFAGREIMGKKLGVIGLGAIGVKIANTCKALGMDVVGYDPYVSVKAAHTLDNDIPIATDLNAMVADCDYITIHVPASPNTNGMINEEVIASMKDGAALLNFSRDKLADEKAVLAALESGKLRKYITDFPNETTIGKDKVLYIPHLGASTEEAEDNCAMMAVEELRDYIENGNITNSVNYPACSLGDFNREGGKTRIGIMHKNIPGMIGEITKALGAANINIDNMINKSRDNVAYTMIETDTPVADDFACQLTIDGIIKVRVIK